MTVSNKISNGINVVAALVALYAALFFWTRGWIGFSFQSIPWLFYTMLPYIVFLFLSMKLQKPDVTAGRNVLFVFAAIFLFVVAVYSYSQFIDEYMVFYLRQSLFIVPPFSLIALLLIVGLGSLLTRRSSGTPQKRVAP